MKRKGRKDPISPAKNTKAGRFDRNVPRKPRPVDGELHFIFVNLF
jgi:hypothetical protein